MVTDPVGDLIIRLKNAGAVKKELVSVPYSKFKAAIAETLRKAGYVGTIAIEGAGIKKTLSITLLYDARGIPKIRETKRISKPGRRLYAPHSALHPVKYGKGVMVISTPRGVLTDAEARKLRAGGETLFAVW